MKNRWILAPLAAIATLSTPHAFAAEQLTVYSAFETDMLAKFKQGFEQANPDITIKWVRDSTGIMTAKLLAEKDAPRADVVWGLAGSSMALLKDNGILKAYTPKGIESIRPNLIDPQPNKAWFGNDAFFIAVCYNEVVAKQLGLEKPTSWQDLLKPQYQGHIAMPNPASSGTGYMQVSAWLQSMGDKAGWAYMTELDKNIDHYTHSGSKPCVQAAQGEVAIGISMAIRGATLKNQGAPIDIIMPKEGVGWEAEAVGLVNTQSDAAKRLVDWSVSADANKLYNQFYPVVGIKSESHPIANYPNVEQAMANMDFSKMASNRTAILKLWSQKFDSKSEPKS
ncbi:putative 2-aminoethylphosphonate ABC transporter substrate-binding protein [Photobacterium kishitanii]|uniref:putative 2-aminoethylphosphonate ABC transporter substrate-binding protein n=1 Tax=Photobacterium kishitanii TaxID=318456 RepID=UPI0007EFD19B|nr:putative 2-aminoethylphosphonate ABC transporter substrate-binding protein [Photobacterium kishitanii]OBU29165.1 putative 2-aminoethylphosphonate ABC transporter substrate-binding protein [Photobacterium kishitanii]PSW69644.1 putative 2-aminoethylphosphonate ABC transporter substrate-binding protein [Photobacterium kishitanii]